MEAPVDGLSGQIPPETPFNFPSGRTICSCCHDILAMAAYVLT